MTVQNAIKHFTYLLEHSGLFNKEHKEALQLAIEALKKQVPVRVPREKWELPKCPCCGASLGEWLEDGYVQEWDHLTICKCGQQLDWSYPEDDEDD